MRWDGNHKELNDSGSSKI